MKPGFLSSAVWAMCSASMLFLVNSSPVQAQEVLFADNFNDNDFSNWQVVRNRQWSNPTQPCYNDWRPAQWEIKDGELGITIDGPGCVTEIIPENVDLSQVEAYEIEFDWNFQETTIMDRNAIFIWQDANNWYDIKLFGNSILIQKIVGGTGYSLPNNTGTYPFQVGQKYTVQIKVVNQKIEVLVDGDTVVSVLDMPPLITGFRTFGLQASSGAVTRSVSYFDNVSVRSLPASSELPTSPGLSITTIKQTDPQWANLVYDTATKWSTDPTIARWGCALSSAVMIFQYHGISHLPNGSVITPATLNGWLLEQPDGYLGEGLVNWLALTRLSQTISTNLGTPKLEYTKKIGDSMQTAQESIKNEQPVILQIPGHFMVGTGVTDGAKDLIISDPAYTFTKLSQHHKPLVATGVFTPSHTDLSYILATYQQGVSLIIKDSTHQLIDTAVTQQEQMEADGVESQQAQPLLTTMISKPETGKYIIEARNTTSQPSKITLYTYDQAAKVQEFSFTVPPTADKPMVLLLTFAKQGSSTIEEQNTFNIQGFRSLLRQLRESRQIRKRAVYLLLDHTAKHIEQHPSPRIKTTTLRILKQQLKITRRFMTHDAYSQLSSYLAHLPT